MNTPIHLPMVHGGEALLVAPFIVAALAAGVASMIAMYTAFVVGIAITGFLIGYAASYLLGRKALIAVILIFDLAVLAPVCSIAKMVIGVWGAPNWVQTSLVAASAGFIIVAAILSAYTLHALKKNREANNA